MIELRKNPGTASTARGTFHRGESVNDSDSNTTFARTCSISSCARKHYCRGFCQTHYWQDYRQRNLDKERARWLAYAETRWGDERAAREDALAARLAASEKTCSKCGVTKPKTEFHKDARRKDGLYSWCSSCFNSHVRAMRDPAVEAARGAKYRATQEGRENAAARSKKWAKTPRGRLWHRENQRKRGASRVDYAEILAEHGMICHICGGGIESISDLHMDHVIPLAQGGPHAKENIRPSHAVCNLSKGARQLGA